MVLLKVTREKNCFTIGIAIHYLKNYLFYWLKSGIIIFLDPLFLERKLSIRVNGFAFNTVTISLMDQS